MSLPIISGIVYLITFTISLLFYTSRFGSEAIYFGLGALVIDLMAIVAGIYAIYFAFLSYAAGLDLALIFGIILIGSVVSAMHLAKWIVRLPMPGPARQPAISIARSFDPRDTNFKRSQ